VVGQGEGDYSSMNNMSRTVFTTPIENNRDIIYFPAPQRAVLVNPVSTQVPQPQWIWINGKWEKRIV